MKYLSVLLIFLSSCSSFPKKLMKYDDSGFSCKDNIFYYYEKPFAKIQALTYSLDGSKFVKEINIKLFEPLDQTKIPSLIKYIHVHQPNVEVEVEIDVD